MKNKMRQNRIEGETRENENKKAVSDSGQEK